MSIKRSWRTERCSSAIALPFIASAMLFGSSVSYATESDESAYQARIIGGSLVPQGERTFQVALLQGGQQVCGGSIIADNWVLTAAHCVTGGANPNQILSGSYDRRQGGQRHSVAQVIVHPGWQGTGGGLGAGNDIALIRINGTFASGLERLKLATPSIMASYGTVGTEGTVSGWGNTAPNTEGGTDQMRWVSHAIISDGHCQQLAQRIDSIDDPATTICGYTPNKSACHGDSGGPFTINGGGVTYSAGVVSWGPPRVCDSFTAYAETANYVNWIGQYVSVDTGSGGGSGDGSGGGAGDGSGGSTGNTLENGRAVTVSGARNSDNFYSFELPSGVSSFTVAMSGGSGDADLYVKRGTKPTEFDYDCRHYKDGNIETCTENNASAGTYYVNVKGYASFSGVQVQLDYQGGSGSGGGSGDGSGGGSGGGATSCPAGHQPYTGQLGADGSAVIGGSYYYASSGTHSAVNIGSSVSMTLYKWASSWQNVKSSSSSFSYNGSAGYYAVTVSGSPGAAYNVCVSTP